MGDNPMAGQEQEIKALKPLVNHLQLLPWQQPNRITTRIINITNNMPNNFLNNNNNMLQRMQPGNINNSNSSNNNSKQETLNHSKRYIFSYFTRKQDIYAENFFDR